ncbi:NAD(P)/FAD-dependent oxidoreductase [Dactylosporangium sucinum]|uniref:Pyridine nucleotide-disulfide oxidoreductase n=1 Tax=Dactylosporangium sucinum TaxID=1424081 RepID=A0A917TF92_9ACTN|nr:FAD-dependent oxidoreductase [Dactylosporangium sucinum]GGM20742.1 pyridine nucleotide-disulfide oxidoreductase [Dactylosporangium sucinum]
MTGPGIVVVGGGLGGLRAVESLRRLGHTGPVTLVSDERLAPYDRPPLSKQLLHPDRLGEPPFLCAPEAYDGLCELVLGRRAVHLDVAAHTVLLDDGTAVPYTAAVLATGTSPRRLPVLDGLSHTVRTYDDAVRLRRAILDHERLAVVGAGFMGCEIASAATAAGTPVTVIEAAPTPLFGALGPAVGAHVRDLLAADGVDVRCCVSVTGVGGDGGHRRLVLSDGGTVGAAVVAECVGVRPAVDWLRDAGLELADGIVCDAYGETSARDVYAVGDAAAWRYPGAAAPVRVEHWTTTTAQAQAVARNLLAGRDERQPLDAPLHYFWSDQCGTKLQCFGLPGAADEVELRAGADGRSLLAAYGDGRRATAVLGIGRPKQVLHLRTRLASGASFAEVAGAVRELAAA